MIELEFPLDWRRIWSDHLSDCSGKFRCHHQDFQVDEDLGFEPMGEGEHLYIQIEKIGQNTQWAVEALSRELGIPKQLFGRSGIKDRHAVTNQWLSVQQPGSNPDFDSIQIPGIRILQVRRHPKKLRPGTHLQNSFRIVLRDLSAEPDRLEEILSTILVQGFPNYFGEQRFGIDSQNLRRGWKLLAARRLGGHKKKGIYLSALRSFVFNQVLSSRIENGLIGSVDGLDTDGPLWGRGMPPISDKQREYELLALEKWLSLLEALEFSGLRQERRPLMVIPKNLVWQWLEKSVLLLEFGLPAGSYATSLIRELGDIKDVTKEISASVK